MSAVLFKLGVILSIAVLASCLLYVSDVKPARAEGGIISPSEFVEGFNMVAWGDPLGRPSHPSSFVKELEKLSGLTVATVFRFDVPSQVWETYIPGAPALVNTLRELPPSAILAVRLQCAVLPQGIEFSVEDGVSCQERQSVAEGLSATRNYLQTLGKDVGRFSVIIGSPDFLAPVFVERVGNVSLSEARNRLQNSTAQMRRNTIFVNTDDGGWKQASPSVRAAVAGHELVHIVQVSSGCDCSSATRWLWEGWPEFVAWKALDNAGLYDFARARDEILQESLGVFEPLEFLSSSFGFNSVEGRFALAFDAINFLSGDSPISLIRFWDAVGRDIPWEQAFFDEFGVTPERFYEEFEAYRVENPNNPRNPIHPFGIELLPGPLPYWFPERSDTVFYLFRVYGVDLKSLENDLPAFPVIATPYSGAGGRWGVISTRNLIFKLIPKTALPGTVFEITFTLGDGRSASTSFTHR